MAGLPLSDAQCVAPVSADVVRPAADPRARRNRVPTGEDTAHRGVARPNPPFTIGAARWSALERVARHGEPGIDDAAFAPFAKPATSTSAVDAWSIGVNGYLTRNLKLVANHAQASFDDSGGDREAE